MQKLTDSLPERYFSTYAILFFFLITFILIGCSVDPVTSLSATNSERLPVHGGPKIKDLNVIGQIDANSRFTLNGREGDDWVWFSFSFS